MKTLKYTSIKGPKGTITDYLQTLNNDDLNSIYNSSFFYDLKLPGLMRKLEGEMHKRKMVAQPTLF